jgi:hypothetical protein
VKEDDGRMTERFTIQNEKHTNFPTVNTIYDGNDGKPRILAHPIGAKKIFFGFL